MCRQMRNSFFDENIWDCSISAFEHEIKTFGGGGEVGRRGDRSVLRFLSINLLFECLRFPFLKKSRGTKSCYVKI